MDRRLLERAAKPLTEFGFTALESVIYAFLLQESPATGYRVAQALKRPVANVYKALESLHTKGAVLADDMRSRQYTPVPPGELFGAMEHGFRKRRLAAERALRGIATSTTDDGIYTLADRDQVVARCREMIRRSRDVVIADLFPRMVAEFTQDLEGAARRGVPVALIVYEEVRLNDVELAPELGGDQLERWPGQWLDVVVDGAELLTAYLDQEAQDVYFGLWSRNPYLAWVHHSGKTSEFLLRRFRSVIEQRGTRSETDRLRDFLKRFFAIEAAGYRKARRRSGGRS